MMTQTSRSQRRPLPHPGPRHQRWPAALALAAGSALIGSTLTALPAAAATAAGAATHSASALTCLKATTGRVACADHTAATTHLPAATTNLAPVTQAVSNPAVMVDTRTWTSNGGNTFPGADVPYGMVQWSPDTSPNRNAGGGYNYGDSALTGYSLTHLSGPGCGAAGDIPILPMTGAIPTPDPGSAQTSFTNTAEVAEAGYYSAESNLPQTITSEFTATTHSSMGRFTFPATTQADFDIKLLGSQNPDTASGASIIGTNEVAGSATSGGFCGDSQPYTVYFDIVFDHAFTASQIVTEAGQPGPNSVFLTFDTTSSPVVQAKVGISYVSTANAKLDWQSENAGWNFTAVKAAAQATWNTLLNRAQVSGGTYAKTQQFYSNLYKVQLQPNVTSDVNGQYLGSDLKVHTVAGAQQNQYGMFSGWDIYHGVSQLQAIFDPSAASDQAQSLLNYYAQNGILQQWGYLNLDNYVMVGDPSDAIISDYYAFGARNFDTKTALTDMLTQATTVNGVRPGEALEQKYGYLPSDGSYGCCNAHGQVATLLEYDTADFALSQYAAALGDGTDASMLAKRADNWTNVFDSSTGLLTPRQLDGAFVGGINGLSTDQYVEGDAYEYLWDVPNDYAGLFSLLGGNAKVTTELANYLAQPNAGGMYAFLANEFDHGEQNALDYAGDPAGTEQAVNNIRNSLYTPGPDGLANNDDLGAMSAQYVWEMLGMYPENPGSDTMVFASPGFPKAVLTLPTGKKITITAPGASPTDFYVKSLQMNGVSDSKLSVPFATMAKGATMNWTLSTTPTTWGTAAADAPPSYGPVFAATGSASPASPVLAPGASSATTLSVTSLSGSAQTVGWTATAAAGVTVSPAGGSVTLAAGATATVPVTVTAGTTDGDYSVSFTLTTAAGSALPVPLSVIVDTPGDLAPFYNITGISDDGSPGSANVDGDGFSYSLQALAAAGVTPGGSVVSNGLTYTWPNVPAGQQDAIGVSGQTLALNAPAGATSLGFLGAAYNSPGAGTEGTVTITYTDGTTSTATLGFSDWTLDAGSASLQFGDVIAAATPYRNSGSGPQQIATNVYSEKVAVDSTKTVAGITLPSTLSEGTIAIFAVALG